MRRILILAGLAGALAAPRALADEPGPILGEGTVAVARVDLARLDVAGLTRQLGGEADFGPLVPGLEGRVEGLRKAGVGMLYVAVDLADLPGPPILAVPAGPGADRARIGRELMAGVRAFADRAEADEIDLPGWVVAGDRPTLDRLRAGRPAPRPDLIAALDAGDAATPIRVAVSPGATFRRAIEEATPHLPAALGGGPVEALTREATWLLLEAPRGAGTAARATLHARTPVAAADLAHRFRLAATPLDGELNLRASGEDVVADLGLARAYDLVTAPVRQARERSARAQTINNLKQLALAMLNYHSAHKSFPPAYRAAPDGRPLLSWRVLVLPYLDQQQKLYDEFHLDEPWDSPHNKALIPRMPRDFASPLAAPGLADEGKTTYLTPRGARTMFPGGRGVPFDAVKDGLSNTILIVEGADPDAVTWTKPDDWDTDRRPNLPPRRKDVALGDGSVRAIRLDIKPEVLRKLLTADGNEAVSADEF